VVVQSNLTHEERRQQLVQRLQRDIHDELGIHCVIELVARHTLPRTSSGKLSRSAARDDYLQRRELERQAASGTASVLPVSTGDGGPTASAPLAE
jgi:fatty-acyl-CoA synthase